MPSFKAIGGAWPALLLAFLSCIAAMPALATAAWQDRAIVRQSADASCGLAAVATVLGWSGRPTSELDLYRRLVALVPPDAPERERLNVRGLSLGQLLLVISDQSVVPLAARRTPQQVRRLAAHEPVLALLYMSSQPEDPGHFTVIERVSNEGGFVLADPALGWIELSEQEFTERFARRDGKGISILLRRDGMPLVRRPEGAVGVNSRVPRLNDALTQLATGRTEQGRLSAELDLRRTRMARSTVLQADGLLITQSSDEINGAVQFRYGLTTETQISMGLSFGRSKDGLQLHTDGQVEELNSRHGLSASTFEIALTSTLLDKPFDGYRVDGQGAVALDSDGRLLAITGGLSAEWAVPTIQSVILSAALRVTLPRRRDGLGGGTTLSIEWGGSWLASDSFGIAVGGHFDRELRSSHGATRGLQLAISYQLTRQWVVSPYFRLDRTNGHSIPTIGVSNTFGFRRNRF